jgi:lipopolysaccharide export system protein LptC
MRYLLNIKKIFFIAFLIILLAFTLWLNQDSASNNSTISLNQTDETSDFFIKEAYAIEFDTNGDPIHILKTPYLEHYPKNNTSIFTKPEFTIYSEHRDQPPWFIFADEGRTEAGLDIVYLIHHVLIEQPNATGHITNTLKTEKLTVYTKKNIAETAEPVTIEQPGLEVHSIGMKVYFKEKRVELLNQARGVYDASQTNQSNSIKD